MPLTTLHKYTILVVFVFSRLFIHANNRDTTIVSLWRDGSKKTVSIYKLKRTTDTSGKTIILLKKLKDIKYYKPDCDPNYDEDWEEPNKCEVSKKDFDLSYSIYNTLDSLKDLKASKPKVIRKRKNVITVTLGHEYPRINFPMNINIGDTTIYTYKKRDTVLMYKIYSYQVFRKDTLSSRKDFKFFSAIRVDTFKIYTFDAYLENEVLKADIEAMANKFGIKISKPTAVISGASLTLVSDISKGVKKGATKGLAFTLANLILMQR